MVILTYCCTEVSLNERTRASSHEVRAVASSLELGNDALDNVVVDSFEVDLGRHFEVTELDSAAWRR